MPRYHFNVYDGGTLRDKKSVELPDTNFARREAIRYAGTLLNDGAAKHNLDAEWCIEVNDGEDLILFRLYFFVASSPAIKYLEKS